MTRASERGVALILVLLVMTTISALAMSLALMVSTESRVAAAFGDGMDVLYGADGAIERVLPDLAGEPDLDRVLTGQVTSSFVDGPPGLRRLPDSTFTDLHALTATLNCGGPACDAGLEARWRLYGYGRLPADAQVYVAVWVAAEASDEAGGPPGRLRLTAHAYGLAGARRVVEATVAAGDGRARLLSWREIR